MVLTNGSAGRFALLKPNRYGIGRVMEMALGHIGNDTPIHLSFDVDALDPQWAPSTGTPVRGGLTLREGDYIVECVHETGSLIAMDLVSAMFLARCAMPMAEKCLLGRGQPLFGSDGCPRDHSSRLFACAMRVRGDTFMIRPE